jgi:hypothetical protein
MRNLVLIYLFVSTNENPGNQFSVCFNQWESWKPVLPMRTLVISLLFVSTMRTLGFSLFCGCCAPWHRRGHRRLHATWKRRARITEFQVRRKSFRKIVLIWNFVSFTESYTFWQNNARLPHDHTRIDAYLLGTVNKRPTLFLRPKNPKPVLFILCKFKPSCGGTVVLTTARAWVI